MSGFLPTAPTQGKQPLREDLMEEPCAPMDCSLPGPSIHGIYQARALEWGAIAFSGYIRQSFSNLTFWSHHFVANRWVNSGNSDRLLFLGAPKSLQMVIAAMKLRDAYSLEGKL